jgi:hypothetical protein
MAYYCHVQPWAMYAYFRRAARVLGKPIPHKNTCGSVLFTRKGGLVLYSVSIIEDGFVYFQRTEGASAFECALAYLSGMGRLYRCPVSGCIDKGHKLDDGKFRFGVADMIQKLALNEEGLDMDPFSISAVKEIRQRLPKKERQLAAAYSLPEDEVAAVDGDEIKQLDAARPVPLRRESPPGTVIYTGVAQVFWREEADSDDVDLSTSGSIINV